MKIEWLIITIFIFFSIGCYENNLPSEDKSELDIVFNEGIQEEDAIQMLRDYNVTISSISSAAIINQGQEVDLVNIFVELNNIDEGDKIRSDINEEEIVYSCEYVKKIY